ncbi:MAG TPA: alkaline phosphatase [Oceanipulchritudo sp.]|nr:alkaline phosphatase [Oceanipulchritudo sp.]
MKLGKRLLIGSLIGTLVALPAAVQAASAVFIHPDGTGLGHWNAARLLYAGPDGMLNWDRMERLSAYRVHQKNWLSSTSHAGATVHAYGKKVHYDSYGLDREEPITALSGKPLTIMEEAMTEGIRVGIVNSGHIGEPGTGVFLARNNKRSNIAEIAVEVLESGADLIFCGGEIHLLPDGVKGRHGEAGVRADGRDLLEEARGRGYTVIYTREELLKLDPATEKVIGIFAARNTYNDEKEAVLKKRGLETYNPGEPTFDELVAKALAVLAHDPERDFFLVAEEEGTDNFSNKTNARGMLDAMGRADRAIGLTMDFITANPERPTLLVVAADTDAGHPAIWAPRNADGSFTLPERTSSGAELDGIEGMGGKPFMSQPDAYGNRYPFGIAWATSGDFQGSVVAKAHGYGSEHLGVTVDNTGIYPILYSVLFED